MPCLCSCTVCIDQLRVTGKCIISKLSFLWDGNIKHPGCFGLHTLNCQEECSYCIERWKLFHPVLLHPLCVHELPPLQSLRPPSSSLLVSGNHYSTPFARDWLQRPPPGVSEYATLLCLCLFSCWTQCLPGALKHWVLETFLMDSRVFSEVTPTGEAEVGNRERTVGLRDWSARWL